jgi:hypothetical protein
MQPVPGRRIPDPLYAELCESLGWICEAADLLPVAAASPLAEWRKWADGVLSGLYYRKTAQRALEAARSGRRVADQPPEIWLAEGAARIAEAFLLAIEGNHRMASAVAAQAASLGAQSHAACRLPGVAR